MLEPAEARQIDLRAERASWRILPASEFGSIAAGWQNLNESLGNHPLWHPDFVQPLLARFGTSATRIALLGNPEHPLAIALLEPERAWSWRTFQPSQAPLGMWLQEPTLNAQVLFSGLLQSLPWLPVSLAVTNIDPCLYPRPAHTDRLSTVDHIDTAQVLVSGTFNDYWSARASKLRQETSRRLNRLRSQGTTLTLDVIRHPAEVQSGIDEFGRIESSGWKGRAGTSVSAENEQGRFYADMLRAFCARGLGRIYRLRFDDRTAAMQLAVADAGMLVLLKTTYVEEFRSLAPGILMQRAIFEQVYGEGNVQRIEFYGRTGEPQAKWCDNRVRSMYHLNYYRHPVVPALRERVHALRARFGAKPADAATEPPSWQLHDVSSFATFKQGWRHLVSLFPPNPVISFDCVHGLLTHFASGNEVLCVLGDPESPKAMAVVQRSGWGAWTTFQPAQGPLGAWLHDPSCDFEQLLGSLLGKLPGAALYLSVTQLDPDLFARPAHSRRLETIDYIPTARIRVEGELATYLAARDKKVLREVARRLRRLDEAGIVPNLTCHNAPVQIRDAVKCFGRLETAGWKGRDGTAIHRSNAQGRFYDDFLGTVAEQGRARVYEYRFGDTTVAMQLCAIEGETLVFLKTTYDESFRRYSPGILMKKAIIEDCFQEGKLKRIEFYGRLSEWQSRWVDETRKIYHVNYSGWGWVTSLQRLRHGTPAYVADAPIRTVVQASRSSLHASRDSLQVKRYDRLTDLPPAYSGIFDAMGARDLFLSREWFAAFAAHLVGPTESMRIYGLESKDPPRQAMAMLLMHDHGAAALHARRLTGLANYYSFHFGPLFHPDCTDQGAAITALVRGMTTDDRRWDTISIHPLAQEDRALEQLKTAFEDTGMLADLFFVYGNWYLQVAGRSYAQYVETLSSSLRNTIERKRRHLEALPNFRIQIGSSEADLPAAMSAYERVYAASWKVAEPYPDFIRALTAACAKHGWLRLGIAYLGEQPIAAQIWIVRSGTASIFKLAYDQNHAKLSAGSVLSAAMMRHAIDVDRVETVDYLSGDDKYKRDWMSHRREMWGVIAFNRRTIHGLAAAARHFAGTTLRRLKAPAAPRPSQAAIAPK